MAGIRGVDYIDKHGNRVLTGGKLAAATNKAKNPNFYAEIGKLSQARWERNGRKPRGFAANPELARIAGAKGGKISKRKPRADK